jgi:hypothetical protein
MPKRSDKPRRPVDTNQLARAVVDLATGAASDPVPPVKNPAAVALGRLGGLKGGKARAAKLSKKHLSAIGKKGAAGRWGKKRGDKKRS